LGGVIEHEKMFRLGDRRNAIVVRGLPEEVHRDDGPGTKPSFLRRRAGPAQAFGIKIEAGLLHVRENRRCANEGNHLGGGGEGEARADHGVARPDALRHQCQNQRVSAACARHGMARAAERGELGFECAYLGPQDELAMAQHARDCLVDRSPQASALRSHVDERN
jgi:hypothetical protein